VHEGAEFAVAGKLYAEGVVDLFFKKLHGVGGVETSVFTLSPIENYAHVFDGLGEVFAFAGDVEACFADGDGDFSEGNKREVDAEVLGGEFDAVFVVFGAFIKKTNAHRLLPPTEKLFKQIFGRGLLVYPEAC
jgi:hypothetical protein